MTEYRRFRNLEAPWFFTVNLAERKGNQLWVNRIAVLRAAFAKVRAVGCGEERTAPFASLD
jgi:putative transposase